MPPATTKNETVAGTTRCARERSWRSSADMAEPPCDKGRPRRRETPGCADPHSAGAEETSVVDHGGGGAAEDLFPVLVGRDEVQVDQPLRALLPERLDRRPGGEGVARPHLGREAASEAADPSVADPVGDHLAGHAHGEHPVGEHAGIAGHLGGEDLIAVQWVVVARGAGVLDDLGAAQVVHHHLLVLVAHRQALARQCHQDPSPTGRSVRTPTLRAVTTSSPFWSRYSVIDSLKTSLPARRPSFSHLSPGRVVAVSTSPGRRLRWYS